jgi:hypothetical protein
MALLCIVGGSEKWSAEWLLAQAEARLGIAASLIEGALPSFGHSPLYRVTATLDEIRRGAVRRWDPLTPHGTVVPRPLLKTFGKAMIVLVNAINAGLALEKAGEKSDTGKIRFGPIRHCRADALQWALLAFQAAGATKETEKLLDDALTLVPPAELQDQDV